MAKHSDVDVVVNFASSRSVYSSTMELMEYPQIKTIAIIAEGVPERVRLAIAKHKSFQWLIHSSSVLVKSCMSLRRKALPSLGPPLSEVSSLAHSRSVTLVV